MNVRLAIAILLAGLLIAPPLIGRGQQSGVQWPGASKRFALLIGVNAYDDPQIRSLVGPSNDMRALEDALVNRAGFDRNRIIRLSTDQNDNRNKPTRANIFRSLSNVLKTASSDGLFVLAFSGHGVEREGRAFLLPSDAQVNSDISLLENTAVEVSAIKKMIRDKKDATTGKATGVAQVVVLLDACRNDPSSGKDLTINPMTKAYDFDLRNSNVKAFVTLYATSLGFRAYEDPSAKLGYFIGEIVNALNGSAANGRGEVTLESLIRYVEDKVPTKVALAVGQDQKPYHDISGFKASDLVISVNAAPRPALAPTPRMSVAGVPLVTMSFTTANTNADGKAINQRTERRWGYIEDLGNGVKLEMVEIPEGEFLMGEDEAGSTDYEKECARYYNKNDCARWAKWQTPQRSVKVNGFLMGKHEVTQRQWVTVMGSLPPGMLNLSADFKGDDLPVVCVSWEEAREFIRKLNEKLNLSGSVYRLPSEAEWEYAARAGTKSQYAFGETIGPDVVNYDGNYPHGSVAKGLYRGRPIKVGSFPANAWGLFDMHGNVLEMCEDDWHDSYIGAPTNGRAWMNEAGAGSARVSRGGGWGNGGAVSCRSANRCLDAPSNRVVDLGFRLVRAYR